MKNVLIIEDEKTIRDLIADILSKKNFIIHHASDGIDGLSQASLLQPDIIISDIMMPKLDGFGVLRNIRNASETQTIPFIFLTGCSDRNDLRKGMELGADDFISKPFSISDVLNSVEIQIQKQENRVKQLSSEMQRSEVEINKLLRFDALTGLPNRASVREYFNSWVADYAKEKIAFFSLTLDHFRLVYDVYGHRIADKMVKEVSNRLKNHSGPKDVVARLQDSDFLILSRDFNNESELHRRVSGYLDLLKSPCDLDGHQVQISGSIGIAVYPWHDTLYDYLLRKANIARYNVKAANSNAYELYEGELEKDGKNNFAIESALRAAIEHDKLQLYYQPIAAIDTGNIIGAEALLRFNDYHKGVLSPTKFIPIAEMSDLIIEVGDYVIRKAAHELADIQRNGFPDFRMSINISAGQFREYNLVENILRSITDANIDPSFFTLELTETDLVKDEETSYTALRQLKEKGIKIAIDDFGMGYSSFSHLQKFDFDFLKMDQYFVRHLHESDSNKEITRSIIQMAHNLKLRVIAEGVETETQRTFLQENNCDKCQGFLISKPLPPSELSQFLDDHK